MVRCSHAATAIYLVATETTTFPLYALAQLHNVCRKVFALQHLGKVEELMNLEGVLNALPGSLSAWI